MFSPTVGKYFCPMEHLGSDVDLMNPSIVPRDPITFREW